MLSISMTYNVISYKKNQKKQSNNQNRLFYFINWAPELRNDQGLTGSGFWLLDGTGRVPAKKFGYRDG